jgi:Cof subfamily protein (haloacid dehalogenase superfamily)
MFSGIKMILTDLDGTLLNHDKKIGLEDLCTLQSLGQSGIVRVFATGRNLFSANNVLSDDCPFDYLVFSAGAGIMNWKTKEILFQSVILNNDVHEIEKILKNLNLNFSIQLPIPNNHKYFYHKGNSFVADFESRNSIYKDYNYVLNGSYPHDTATQFIVILNHEHEIQPIIENITGFKVMRATSPIDGKSVWIEIFSEGISKASGGQFLCSMLNISQKETLGIGNDYNDIDMLNWTARSFIVSNAPEAIKNMYLQCTDNQDNPLTDVMSKYL